jgi:hypothetical protein
MKSIFFLLCFNFISLILLADPGVSSSISVCQQEPSFSLYTALLGTPDAGGVWTNSDNVVVNEIFVPGVTPAGVYTYSISGESATVTISFVNCASVPANNQCLNAQFVFPNSNIPFTTFGATTDGLPHFGEANCEINGQSQTENDVWFFYQASCNGIATVSTVGGTSLNTKVSVYNFNCPATTEDLVGCSDNFGLSYQSQVSWPIQTNGVYLIRIGESPGPGSGNGTFSLTQTCDGQFPPVNNSCESPTVITPATDIPFTTLFATTDGPAHDGSTCQFEEVQGIGGDVWFSYTASCSGSAIFNAIGGTFFDSRVDIYSESCPTDLSSLIACNDDYDGYPQSYLEWAIEEGLTYTIRLGGIPNFPGGNGTFQLIELCENTSPANNNCANAQVITPGAGIPFSTYGASTDGPSHTGDAGCDIFGQSSIELDVWYSYTASCDGIAEFSTVGGTNLDTRIAVYALYCPNDLTNLIICNDDASSFQSTVSWTVVEGETYLLRLGEFPGQGGGSGTFNLTETCMEVCAMPLISYQTFCNGLNDFDSYFITAQVVTMGNNAPYTLTASTGGDPITIESSGEITLGPFNNGFPVQFEVSSINNAACSASSLEFINNCQPNNTNDTCADALPIFTNTLISFNNDNALTDGDSLNDPFCGLNNVYNDLWYVFTAACLGEVTITTCPFSTFNTAIAVYQYSCENQADLLVACSVEDSCGEFAATVTAPTAQGISYLIRIGGAGPEDKGNAVFTIEENVSLVSAGNDTTLNICQGSVNNLVLNQWISGEQSGGIWTDNDNSGALLGNVLFLTALPSTGIYNFSYFVEGPCNAASSTITVNYQLCTSIEEAVEQPDFVLYPNPTSDLVFIKSNGTSGQHLIRVLDLSGRIIWQQNVNLVSGSPFQLPLQYLMQTGLYFVQITNEVNQLTQTQKLVVK